MVDRLPVVLRTDTTPARLQEMPAGDALPASILGNALARANHTGPLNWAWATYGGTANTVTLAPAFARTAYVAGDEFRFRATAANTGAATINVGSLGAKAAVTVTGAALPAGFIRTGVDTVCVYDGTKFVVQREIERGSNANGRYVRFADGTQLCNRPDLVFGGSESDPAGTIRSVPWVFPAAFSEVPTVTASPPYYGDAATFIGNYGGSSTTGTSVPSLAIRLNSTGVGAVALSTAALGNWYLS